MYKHDNTEGPAGCLQVLGLLALFSLVGWFVVWLLIHAGHEEMQRPVVAKQQALRLRTDRLWVVKKGPVQNCDNQPIPPPFFRGMPQRGWYENNSDNYDIVARQQGTGEELTLSSQWFSLMGDPGSEKIIRGAHPGERLRLTLRRPAVESENVGAHFRVEKAK